MRRTAAALFVLLAACSSSSGPKTTASSGASSASATSTASGAPGPSTTVDPSELSDLDLAGAKAFLTLFANQLKELDSAITQAQVDCVPDAVLERFTPRELFALVDSGLGTLSAEDAAKIAAALRFCGFTDAQIQKAHLS